jgi:hypothetical protein
VLKKLKPKFAKKNLHRGKPEVPQRFTELRKELGEIDN